MHWEDLRCIRQEWRCIAETGGALEGIWVVLQRTGGALKRTCGALDRTGVVLQRTGALDRAGSAFRGALDR